MSPKPKAKTKRGKRMKQYTYLGQKVYVEEQGECKISLLQADKQYALSQFYSNEGIVKAMTNCSYFTTQYVLGRNQGDTFNEAPDQDFYSVVVREDGSYRCDVMPSWEEREGITAGFSVAAVLVKDGIDVEYISQAIGDAKARITSKNPNTAFAVKKDGKALLIVNDGRNAQGNGLTGRELRTFLKQNYDLALLVLLDGGGSSEMIVDGKIVNTPSDGAERKMFNALSFVDAKATQKAILPLRHTWVTQGMNGEYSHGGTKAIDFGSLSKYQDYDLYAPFDCKVVWADDIAKGGSIALQSLKPVVYADGTEDFMTVISEHSNDRPSYGATFKQGEVYAHMGTAGGVARHCHIEVQRGKYAKWTGTRWQSGIKGYVYMFPNTIPPYDALFLSEDTVMDSASVVSYPWKRLTYVVDPVQRNLNKNQLKVLVDLLRVRTDHKTDAEVLGFAKQDGIYNDLGRYDDGTYTWHEIGEGQWIADNGEWIELLPSIDQDTDKLLKQIAVLKEEIATLEADVEVKDKTISQLESKLTRATNLYNEQLERADRAVVDYERMSEKFTVLQIKVNQAKEILNG